MVGFINVSTFYLQMSYKHYGESSFICPVCSSPVHPADDFVQLSDAAGYKPKTRWVLFEVHFIFLS